MPMPSISTSTTSPACNGPTPAGVPVRMTSPGSSVITEVMNFMIDTLRLRRPDDRSLVRQQRGGRFQKDDRLGRRFVAELLGVLGVISADGDDLRGAGAVFEKVVDLQEGAIVSNRHPERSEGSQNDAGLRA